MSFTRSLQVEALPDGEHWCVLRSFSWLENGREFRVRCGFVTDFGSIASILVPVAGHPDDHAQAFVLHDKGYKDPEGLTRLEWDAILDRALKWLGASLVRRIAIRSGLFVGGYFTWSRYRRAEALHFDP